MNKNGIGGFLKDNFWKIVTIFAGFVIAWTTLQGVQNSNTARIVKAEEKIETIEDALKSLVRLEERDSQTEKDIGEIKGYMKDLNDKIDSHILGGN